ncbi:hypothetical protein GGQ64_005341 [Rhizobium azooxidifex]|uniref:N-acetyltransferase domain-containing protein n=1 Tax=Mycoplana azooxidifex TaxID=1636188 RepID=A0A7W6DCK1_9HYPH|nr:hypothetical protein [Mycoplana azooxidifex]MBB3980094.1 hypothetical protein [Mycoplana azooxidifex]
MIVEARAEHVVHVFARLCPQTKAEMAIYGWDRDTVLDRYLKFAARGEHFAILERGAPISLIAFAQEGESVLTFMVGADGFFERSLGRRREFQRFMKERAAEYGDIFTISKSPDPNFPRWMKAMGAVGIGEYKGDKVFLWA